MDTSDTIIDWFYFALPLAICVIFWFVWGERILGRRDIRRPSGPAPPPTVDPKDYIHLTKEELWNFNADAEKNYIGIKNDLFDVTGSEHYMTGGTYAMFTGREVSVAMAKTSTEMKDVEADYMTTKLSAAYLDSLDQWHSFFSSKYPMIGKVVTDKKND